MKSFQPGQAEGLAGNQGGNGAESEAELTGNKMPRNDRREEGQTILRDVLANEGDEEALDKARRNVDAIEEYLLTLDHEKPNFLDQIVTSDMNPEWFALVLEVLGRDSPVIDMDTIEPLLRAVEDDEESIGEAMRDVFVADLPGLLADFERWYGEIALIDRFDRRQRQFLEWLEERPSMRAFREHDGRFGLWEPLLMRGITPITILRATQAVAGIVDPVLRPEHALERLEFSITGDYSRLETESCAIELIAGEIALMCECTPAMADLLLRWLVAASISKPYLFDGCTAQVGRAGPGGMAHVVITYTGKEVPDLYMRWRTVYE